MDFSYSATQREIAEAVTSLAARFPDEYWRRCDAQTAYPEEFVAAMTEAGWLAALIPEAFGGSGLGLLDACVILQEINRNGGNGAACHAQMYTMASVLKHGSEAQKHAILPRIASGDLRLQAFGVTEPDAGSNTLRIKTFARKVNGGYVINGQKIWTSRFRQSDYYLLLARTTPSSPTRASSVTSRFSMNTSLVWWFNIVSIVRAVRAFPALAMSTRNRLRPSVLRATSS